MHDSPDYHSLKVSVFNDDKKTELIGETWVSLENVLLPGGGQSDGWHGLNCRGKYAGEIRIELTYYDTRPKAEKAQAERKKEGARPEHQSPQVGGPRESAPVKRRPLPTDPTGPSPAAAPVAALEHRGLPKHAGPRAYNTRRPVPESSPLSAAPAAAQQRSPRPDHDGFGASPVPQPSSAPIPVPQQHSGNGYDMSYAAPKSYEVPPIDAVPHHVREHSHAHRAASQDNFRTSRESLAERVEPPHSYSAPVVPTQHTNGYAHQELQYANYAPPQEAYSDSYQDPEFRVEPLRPSRSNTGLNQTPTQAPYQDPYQEPYQAQITYPEPVDPYPKQPSPGRPYNTCQPTVEDEGDCPPPPPVHRTNAATVPQPQQQHPPSYHPDAPAPLTVSRYREDAPEPVYGTPPQTYTMIDYAANMPSDRRYTHPQPSSRPVSRDTMAPSPLRSETNLLPASLVAGFDASRMDNRQLARVEPQEPVYQAALSYDTPRTRQLSEPSYAAPPQYETPPPALPYPTTDAPGYYPYDTPEEPRHISPVHDPLQVVKPRAVSPGRSQPPVEARTSRTNLRGMPTRKSVSPRPPPSADDKRERRLSGVPFAPDDFDVYNPNVAKKSGSREGSGEGRGAEVNEKGQVVTFSGRVIDASDHLPLDSWAPEPEVKGTKKERPVRERAALTGSRDLDAAMLRERDYRRERMEKEKIRNAANHVLGDTGVPSNALVSRHHYSSSAAPVDSSAMVLHRSADPDSRNRPQQRSPRPTSTYIPPTSSSTNGVLRERENVPAYSSSPGYGSSARHSVAAPPIPAKIPMDFAPQEEISALSLELQSIDIGPARPRGTIRNRYGGY